jgi:hypothetical protein
MTPNFPCKACGRAFDRNSGGLYCSPKCRTSARAPTVHRYVGSAMTMRTAITFTPDLAPTDGGGDG